MKLSSYFRELYEAYAVELDDLTYDSAGDNVLKFRLKDKREQIDDLLAMIDLDPGFVASAWHGGFAFTNAKALEALVAREPEQLPSWRSLSSALKMQPWAEKLAQHILEKSPAAPRFLVITAGLEYILSKAGSDAVSDDMSTAPERDNEDEEIEDLGGEAGEEWLGEQGFDRRS